MTDLEKACQVISQLETLSEDALQELEALRDANQNASTGDGSFDQASWTTLRNFIHAAGEFKRFHKEAVKALQRKSDLPKVISDGSLQEP